MFELLRLKARVRRLEELTESAERTLGRIAEDLQGVHARQNESLDLQRRANWLHEQTLIAVQRRATAEASSAQAGGERKDVGRRFFNLHIAKTGGTTFNRGYLLTIFPESDRYCQTDAYDDRTLVSRDRYHDMLLISRQAEIPFWQVFRFFTGIGIVPADRAYYSGHICYGVHRCFAGDYRYFVLLREPVARIRSHYRNWLSLMRGEGSYNDFVAAHKLEIDNYQVRCLVEDGWLSRPCDAAMLDEAKHNLVADCIFGTTEAVDEMVARVGQELGLELRPRDLHLNRSVTGEPLRGHSGSTFVEDPQDLTAADLEDLRDRNRYDRLLFEFVEQRLRA